MRNKWDRLESVVLTVVVVGFAVFGVFCAWRVG